MHKDILGLIRAMKHVKGVVPDVVSLVQGEAPDLDYAKRRMNEVKAHGVEDNLMFKGGTDEPQRAIEGRYEGAVAR